MEFVVHNIETPLSNFIESIFHFKGFKPDHSIERVIPTGHIFIIFELDGFKRNTYHEKTLEPKGSFTDVWISGNHRKYLSISAHQNSEMLVVQLKPEGFYPIIHQSALALNDKVIQAQEIFGSKILELRKALFHEKEIANKFTIIENWLSNRLNYNKVPNQELIDILQQLKSKPISNHTEIVLSYSKTQKHLINQFKKYFGLTPKVFHRVYRFNEILKEIHEKETVTWSQISYQFGYTDQSHFIKEFKEFSGVNPQEYIISDFHNEQPNFFPLDRKG